MKTGIVLSTMEAEHIDLSHSMRKVILLLYLIQDIHHALCLPNTSKSCATKCTAFEDNNRCVELATCPRLRHRTKHNGIKYHHFRRKVSDGTVNILPNENKDPEENIFTKLLAMDQFIKLRRLLVGW